MGALDVNNNDMCINSKQRPRILLDLEVILSTHITRSQTIGMPITYDAVRFTCQRIYDRLRTLDIYYPNRTRKVKAEVLTQTYIDYVLKKNPVI